MSVRDKTETTRDAGYDPQAIERKWQAYWLEHKTFRCEVDYTKPKYYVLDMFPYPSGDGLHVGHPEGYTATDIVARYKRMRGFNVLHPMGWDAFGLPAERHAVRTGEHPSKITNRNCDTFRRQIQELGLSYDWDREINTTDPKYYKWTQWIFEVLYERGLAYQTEAPVNWCPALGTVLANEEVKDGKYVDTGDPVEKRQMKQWMLRITAYAERLLADLEELDWPEGIKAMQREWIGRSEGADIEFKVADSPLHFTVYTTRPDTLFGATYCVLAPEHPLTLKVATAEQRAEVEAYVEAASKRSAQERMKEEREKTGAFTGAFAINPANDERIPIWTADYVLAEYGYGAIMAVPGQDERDWAFAEKFGLPIIRTVQPSEDWEGKAYTGEGPAINSDFLNGLNVKEAKRAMIAWLEEHHVGRGTVNYRLRDWLFSRQRYWGEPFPLIELEDGSIKAVPMKDLPVVLPELDEYKPTEEGEPPLARAEDWVNTTDPETGQPARRETNTMPQWAGSCWYFLRFCDPDNDEAAWSPEAESYWMPVDLYIGGAEHAVLHLLYARFWHKVLYDAGYVSTPEPFMKLFNQGMILAHSYREPSGEYVHTEDVDQDLSMLEVTEDGRVVETKGFLVSCRKGPFQMYRNAQNDAIWYDPIKGVTRDYKDDQFLFRPKSKDRTAFLHGRIDNSKVREEAVTVEEPPVKGYSDRITFFSSVSAEDVEVFPHLWLPDQVEKMSKSRYNVVNPDDVVRAYGADSMRLYEMFMGPLDRDKPWTDEGVQGVHRFLRRVWSLYIGEDGGLSEKIVDGGGDEGMKKLLHKTIKAVTDDIEELGFNTAIARMMEFVNGAMKAGSVDKEWAEEFVLLLSPFAPHLAEELWARLGHGETLAYESWPSYDPALLTEDAVEVPVQVNGKVRARITVSADADQAAMLDTAKADENVQRYIAGKTIVKEIVVPGKMVNLVVK